MSHKSSALLKTDTSTKNNSTTRFVPRGMIGLILALSVQQIFADNVSNDTPAVKFSCAILSQSGWQSPDDVPWDFHYTPTANVNHDFFYTLSEIQSIDSGKKTFVQKVATVSPKSLCYESGEELEAKNALLQDALAKGDKKKAQEISKHCPRNLSDLEPDIKTVELKTAIDTTIGQPLFVTSLRMIRRDGKVQYSAYETTQDPGAVPEISYTKLIPHFGKDFFVAPESRGQDFYISMGLSCKVMFSSAVFGTRDDAKPEMEKRESITQPTEPNDEANQKYKQNPYYNPKLPIWSA
jgi:hypothetical protein